jgi:hypothetical protein
MPAGLPSAEKNAECLACHRERQPGLVLQHEQGLHAAKGVGCATCHGEDHEEIFRVRGRVRQSRCALCHSKQVEQFRRSAHHRSRTDALSTPMLLAQVGAMQRRGCLGCHDEGAYPEGEVEDPDDGSCKTCHAGHRFRAAEAREPEACGLCHGGPDHPHIEAWERSKHGVVYLASRDEKQSPTCSTCHMPDGDHDVSHGITLGRQGFGAVLEGDPAPIDGVAVIPKAKAREERAAMLRVCNRCHAPRISEKALEDADAIKRECDRLVLQAGDLVRALDREGLLDPSPKDRPLHPTVGHALVLDSRMLYENQSEAERLFFEAAKFAHSITFKSAYHQSPEWTHWQGIVRLKMDLTSLHAEARRLRQAAAQRPKSDR